MFDSTIERKVREAYIAIKMEEMYSRTRSSRCTSTPSITATVPAASRAAAETYLSKSAADLTLSEAALLIGLPNSPSQYDPTVNPDLALSRRNKVLDNIKPRLGHITRRSTTPRRQSPSPQRNRDFGQWRRRVFAALLCRLC